MEKDSVLEMRHIYKTFPGVKALQNVDFTLKKGEIHALMGENGAGKSTLIKVLTGVEEFETGEIMIDGCDHTIINRSPQEAQSRGISTVYQEEGHFYCVSGSKPLPQPYSGRKSFYWKRAQKSRADRLENYE